MGTWTKAPVILNTPGKRYGHTMSFCHPNLFVFGGVKETTLSNDIWMLNVDNLPLKWIKIECSTEGPCPRAFHSADLCVSGPASGMLIIFGGRDEGKKSLNDCWGLRKHRNGTWDWIKAKNKNKTVVPNSRAYHSQFFVNTAMVIIGGKSSETAKPLELEVFDTENLTCQKCGEFSGHSFGSCKMGNDIYLFGGELEKSFIDQRKYFVKISLEGLFAANKIKGIIPLAQENIIVTKNNPDSTKIKVVEEKKFKLADSPDKFSDLGLEIPEEKEENPLEETPTLPPLEKLLLKGENWKDLLCIICFHIAFKPKECVKFYY